MDAKDIKKGDYVVELTGIRTAVRGPVTSVGKVYYMKAGGWRAGDTSRHAIHDATASFETEGAAWAAVERFEHAYKQLQPLIDAACDVSAQAHEAAVHAYDKLRHVRAAVDAQAVAEALNGR